MTNCLVFPWWRISGCFVQLVFSSELVWRLGAVNKPGLLCCLKLWNMMGLSVTTIQVFHGQTLSYIYYITYYLSYLSYNILFIILHNIQHKYAFCCNSSWSLFIFLPIKTLTIVLDARVFIQFKDETFGTKTVEEKLPLSSMWEQPPCNWNNLVKCGMVHEYKGEL